MERTLRAKDNEDLEVSVRWTDRNGTPYPLSSGEMQVRTSATATGAPLLAASVTIDGDNWATAVIPAAAMSALTDPPELLVYDFVVTRTSDGRKKILLEGDFVLLPGVTHG